MSENPGSGANSTPESGEGLTSMEDAPLTRRENLRRAQAPEQQSASATFADRIGAQPAAQPTSQPSAHPHGDSQMPGEPVPVSGETVSPAQEPQAVPAAPVTAGSRSPATPAPVSSAAASRAPQSFDTLTEDAPIRRSFLESGPEQDKAEQGFRGVLNKMGFNLRPGSTEAAERHDVAEVSQYWTGPRTIAVVNGKGGANKTPTTVMLASVFARYGGGQILAWDNNETRGTLGWRTAQGRHENTVMDLLPHVDGLLSPSAQSVALAAFVHHQSESKFDVLRSKPDVLASEQKIHLSDFDKLHEVVAKYYRLCVIDSGNDETAERWLRMIHHTNQLVIATTTREEHAEAGALLLEALSARGGRFKELARNSVVIVSQSDKKGSKAHAEQIAKGFSTLARRAVTIPFDQALVKGQIRYSALNEDTQRAWLRAAAAVAEGL